MTLRIVFDGGNGYATKVLDAETGEDLTARLQVTKVEIALTTDAVPTAILTTIAPKVEITVQEAFVQRVCPYCGQEKEHTVRSVNDVDGW